MLEQWKHNSQYDNDISTYMKEMCNSGRVWDIDLQDKVQQSIKYCKMSRNLELVCRDGTSAALRGLQGYFQTVLNVTNHLRSLEPLAGSCHHVKGL